MKSRWKAKNHKKTLKEVQKFKAPMENVERQEKIGSGLTGA